MTKSEQIAYVANIAFADALGSAADGAYVRDVSEVHPDDRKVYDKLSRDNFLRPQSQMEDDALQYKMQPDFVDFAKKLLAKVADAPYWQFLMAVSHSKGQREALYLLYQESVGAGVGFWDTAHTWEDFTDDWSGPALKDCCLQDWAKEFTGLVKYDETPLVSWPLRNARPYRSEP